MMMKDVLSDSLLGVLLDDMIQGIWMGRRRYDIHGMDGDMLVIWLASG